VGSEGDDFAGFELEDAVGQAGLFGTVGDPDAGEVVLSDEAKDEVFDGLAVGGVEGGSGFVEEQEFGLIGEGADEGDALGFSAGERGGVSGCVAGEADFFEHGVDLFGIERDALLSGAEGDVGGDGTGKEVWALHDESDAAAQVGGPDGLCVLTVEMDDAGGGFLEAIEQAQEGTFACAAGAGDGEDFGGENLEADVGKDRPGFGRGRVMRDVDALQPWLR